MHKPLSPLETIFNFVQCRYHRRLLKTTPKPAQKHTTTAINVYKVFIMRQTFFSQYHPNYVRLRVFGHGCHGCVAIFTTFFALEIRLKLALGPSFF